MARLKDIPVVLESVGWVTFGKRVWNEVIDDNLFVYAGSLAYAWLFAIFPFFIFLLNVIPFLPVERPISSAEIHFFFQKALPDQAAETLISSMKGTMDNVLNHPRKGVLSLSLVVALWAASGGITVTMAALDKCYEIDRPRAYYKRRPMAFALTAGVAAILAVVILLLPVGAAFKVWIGESWSMRQNGLSVWAIAVFDLLRGILAILAAMVFLSLLYHFGPSVKQRFRIITPGAVFTLIVWGIVGLGFRAYMARFGGRYSETYGPVGGVAVLLLLFYLDALVLLIGAEINSEIDYAVLNCPRGTLNLRKMEEIKRGKRRWLRRKPVMAVSPAAVGVKVDGEAGVGSD